MLRAPPSSPERERAFECAIGIYEARLKEKPDDLATINELIAAYSRADHWLPAMRWMMRRARIADSDAEAQYTAAVVIANYLHRRPAAHAPADTGARSIPRLAVVAIAFLSRAMELRPEYRNSKFFMDDLRREVHYHPFDPAGELELLEEFRELEFAGEDLIRVPDLNPHLGALAPSLVEPLARAAGAPA